MRGDETRTGLQSLAQHQEPKEICSLQTLSASKIRKRAQTDADSGWSLRNEHSGEDIVAFGGKWKPGDCVIK